MRRKKITIRKINPGYDNCLEVGQTIVENPYDDPNRSVITVNINKRHDILTWWHSRKAIDDAQFAAGRRFQSLWDRARIGGQGSLDPSMPYVDRSLPTDHIQEIALVSFQKLKMLVPVVGQKDYAFLCSVLCEGKTLADLSMFYAGTKGDREYIGWRLRDALDILAQYWGAKRKPKLPITVYHADSL